MQQQSYGGGPFPGILQQPHYGAPPQFPFDGASLPGEPMQQPPYGPGPMQQSIYVPPIVQQPTYVGFSQADVPPGLEDLVEVDQLIVKQQVELIEAFIGFETKNRYTVKNSMGEDIYKAKEQTSCCTRYCCGPIRPFNMAIGDNDNNEVIHLYRPLKCQSCLCPCCLQTLEVSSPTEDGDVFGTVDQEWSVLRPSFVVRDATGEIVLRIKGPCCTFSICGGDVEFKVLSADGSYEVGKISKQWSGILKEVFTDADNYGISFPMDLDVRMKATLLGALFLIDFMFFEKKTKKKKRIKPVKL